MGYRKDREKTTAKLERVIFYRGDCSVQNVIYNLDLTIRLCTDGVSEGQFQHVLDEGKLIYR